MRRLSSEKNFKGMTSVILESLGRLGKNVLKIKFKKRAKMKEIGTEPLRNIVRGAINEHIKGGKLTCGKGVLIDQICDEFEETYQIGEEEVQKDIFIEYLARGGDEKIKPIYDRLCKSLWVDFLPLTPIATEVYQWVSRQDKSGQKIEDFGEWAREPERIMYVRKYRRDALEIKRDWIVAFEQKKFDRMLAGEERV